MFTGESPKNTAPTAPPQGQRCTSPNGNSNHILGSSSLSPSSPRTTQFPLTAETLARSLTTLPTLQGYLLKHNSSSSSSSSNPSSSSSLVGNVVGQLSGSFRKKRWFVFSPVTGKLYYYRTREDLFPIGEIDIRSASFVIKSSHLSHNNPNHNQSQSNSHSSHLPPYTLSLSSAFVFEIVTGTKRLTLEANNAGDGFHWVKNLQIFRQHLCNKYLGLDNETNNNQLIEKPLQFDLSHQTTTTPSTLATESTSSPKSSKVLQNNLDNNSSTSTFYICDTPSSSSPSSSVDTTVGGGDNGGSTDASAAVQQHQQQPHSRQNINKLRAGDRAYSLPNSETIGAPLGNSKSFGGAKTDSNAAMITGHHHQQQQQNSTRPKLFGGIVNRIRPSHSVSQASSAEYSTSSSFSPVSANTTMSDGGGDRFCGRCKKLEEQLITLNHDRYAFEDEMKTNREVIKILQEQLRIFNSEKASFDASQQEKSRASRSTADGTGPVASTSTATTTDVESMAKEMVNLKITCRCLQNENEKLHESNRALSTTKAVLEEMLESRDRTLVSLTHEVYDLESKNSRMATRAELEREYLADEMPRKVQLRIEQLEDTVIAFEQQNEFLNREIIELNDLRHRLELKEKRSAAKLCEVEAKCSQIQSKLLSLLKELNACIQEEEKSASEEFHNQESSSSSSSKNPFFATNESVKVLVHRLLEESSLDIPLSWKPGNRARNWAAEVTGSGGASAQVLQPEYDELGFYIVPSSSSGAQGSESGQHPPSSSYDLMLEPERSEAAWRTKWDQFISNLPNVDASSVSASATTNGPTNSSHLPHPSTPVLRPSLGLKSMLRLGVPQDYRCKMWRLLIHQRVKERRARLGLGEDYYESLLRERSHCGSVIGSPISDKGGSKSVMTTAPKMMTDPSAKQIELDLLRTLPNNRHFEHLESDGIARLRRVLVAYSLHNRTVGYCQGLNRLAAVALLFMPEEDAFWALVAIVETIMPPDYFGRNLMGAHVDQYVLRELITEKLPALGAHMEAHHIEISLFAWFLTVFVDNIPTAVYLHIWDVFLYEGSKVLFRFALAILKMHEADLLTLKDSAAFNQYLRTLEERHFNLKRLSEIAFRGLNPFSSSRVASKRAHYTALVNEELRKIEAIRDQISTANAEAAAASRKDKEVVDGGRASTSSTPSSQGNKKSDPHSQTLISFDDDNDSD